ncbi:MAG: hypothetical protein RR364_02245 [Lachnospiraceae bacterium]
MTIALGTYIRHYLGREASILECCNQDELIQMGVRHATSGSVREDRFVIHQVQYFTNIKEKDFTEILLECKEYIVLDLGNNYALARNYLLQCTQTILLGSLSPWKVSELISFINDFEKKEKKITWCTICTSFGKEKDKKEIKKKVHISPIPIPMIEDPLHLTYENSRILTKILPLS